MKHYTCMIIDDEQDAIDYLSSLINECCPDLELVATATSTSEAMKEYHRKVPELLFLDIEIDEKNGFDFMEDIYQYKTKSYVVFITAYNKYAVDAFKANALDYLLKPCNKDDLILAVNKFLENKKKDQQYLIIQELFGDKKRQVRFNTRTGFILFKPEEIIYCKAERNYTRIYTFPDEYTLVSVNLAEVERVISNNDFWRISRSILVNSEFLTEVDRKQKKCLLRIKDRELWLDASTQMMRKL